MNSKPLTTPQAAKAAGVSRASVQEWIRVGRLKAPKVKLRAGRAVRLWTESDLRHLREVRQQSKLGRPKKKA